MRSHKAGRLIPSSGPVDRLTFHALGTLLVVLVLGRTCLFAQAPPRTCGRWIIGNCNCDATVDIADAVFLLGYLFSSPQKKPCFPLCDFNQSGRVDLGDAISILDSYFFGKVVINSTPSPEEKCDGKDNNCDGNIDENCTNSVDLA